MKQANESRDALQIVGPLHFAHEIGAGGRQLVQPHSARQNQNRQ